MKLNVGHRSEIEHMIKSGQPILVMEKEGKLLPYYLEEFSNLKKIKEISSYKNFLLSLFKPFDYPSFDLKDFDKISQDKIHHLKMTLRMNHILTGSKKKDFKNDLKSSYEMFRNIFALYQPKLADLEKEIKENDSSITLFEKIQFNPIIDIYLKKRTILDLEDKVYGNTDFENEIKKDYLGVDSFEKIEANPINDYFLKKLLKSYPN